MFSLAGASGKKAATRQVTSWVEEVLRVSSIHNCSVVCTEIACQEPGCVPLETLIVVVNVGLQSDLESFSQSQSKADCRWIRKILMPIQEVTQKDVWQVMLSSDLLIFLEKAANADEQIGLPQRLAHSEKIKDQLSELQSALGKANECIQSLLESNSENDVAPSIVYNLVQLQQQMNSTKQMLRVDQSNIPIDNATNNKTPTVSADVTVVSMAPKPIEVDKVATASTTLIHIPMITSSSHMPSPHVFNPIKNEISPALTVTTSTPSTDHRQAGTRPRGCPCCDPDNLANIVDKILASSL